MAQFTLATKQPGRAGSSGGLKADYIQAGGGSRINAAQIAPGAANIKYTPANIPQTVENQVGPGVQHLMSVTAEAAFRYQERESSYFAKEAVASYQDKAIAAYQGTSDAQGNFQPGYNSLKGKAAVEGFDTYVDGLEQAFYEDLENLDPRVRQKAIFEMQTVKKNLRTKAASHRLTEFNALEEEQRFKNLQLLQDEMQAAPESVFQPNQAGMTLPMRARKNFDTDEEYTKWWGDTMKATVENQYWTTRSKVLAAGGSVEEADIEGYKVANDYAQLVARETLQDNPQVENAVLSKLNSMQNDAISARLDLEKLGVAAEEADLDRQNQEELVNLRDWSAKIAQGWPTPTLEEFNEATGHLSQSEYSAWRRQFFGQSSERGEEASEILFIGKARAGILTDQELIQGRTSALISSQVWELSKQLQEEAVRSDKANEYKDMQHHVDALPMKGGIDNMFEFLDSTEVTQAQKANYTEASTLGRECIKSGKGLEQCRTKVTLYHGTATNQSPASITPIVLEGAEFKLTNVDEAVRAQQELMLMSEQYTGQVLVYTNQGKPVPPWLQKEQAKLQIQKDNYDHWKRWRMKELQYKETYHD